MNVVVASYTFLPAIGGVSTNVSILCTAFAAAGHSVTMITLTDGPTEGYGYTVVRRPGFGRLLDAYRKADLIVLSNLALRLIYPLLFVRKPVALRHHSESAFRLSTSFLSPDAIRRMVMSRAKHFMTSEYVGRKSGLPAYVVTPPFADPLHIDPNRIAPPQERQGIIFVGRTEPEKGILWLLDRWATVRGMLGDVTLDIIGSGSLDRDIAARIAGGRAPGVRQVGALSRAETAQRMLKARYSIVPSLWEEPFGAVALESLAAGAITILSNRGGLPETTGPLGFFFDPDDEASFSGALAAARRESDAHLASSSDYDAWNAKRLTHVAAFAPERNVTRIVSAMGLSRAHAI